MKINSHSVQYPFVECKLACVLVTLYTVAGGMVSVAYTGESYDRDRVLRECTMICITSD